MSVTTNATATVTVLFSAEERKAALGEEARLGLTSTPKELPPKWFYDERGSELFKAITQLPEYYLTRAERSILERHAGEIAALTDATTLIELGSGTSDKTRLLLDVLAPQRFVPFDVSEKTLRASAQKLAREYPALEVLAVVGDFEHHLPLRSAAPRSARGRPRSAPSTRARTTRTAGRPRPRRTP
jgi:L-histidine N-alpha-methyltransferase